MEQSTNYKHKIDFLILDNTDNILSSLPTQTTIKKRKAYNKCNECNRRRKFSNESHQICRVCYKIKTLFEPKPSGNKVIDDFIKHTQINYIKKSGKMEFVPYDQFKNIEFVAEGGFSKIYKATWVDGPIDNWDDIRSDNYNIARNNNCTVVLKKLNNSKNITSKELNELKVFYEINSKEHCIDISKYFGITQDPITKDITIIMPFYDKGDLTHYISNDFYNISWKIKLDNLRDIISGLSRMHTDKFTHRDLHSGNIFFNKNSVAYIGDLGISKSAIESTDDNNNENYGIIPYIAPEIFQGQKYTTASDIYSYGMIMWEFMTGRRPFWDRSHDIELIIKICDGLRPPIVTNAPEGYIDLMKECWHSDPMKRSTAADLHRKIRIIYSNERDNNNPTKIIVSSDIGPVATNNPGAIYKSRPLSGMIQSAMSLRSSRSQPINLETDPFYYYQKNKITSTGKRKLENDSIGDENDDQNIKRSKNENNDYYTKEFELDINKLPLNNDYDTKEIDIDINNL